MPSLLVVVFLLSLSLTNSGLGYHFPSPTVTNLTLSQPTSPPTIKEFNLTKNVGPEAIISAPNEVFWFTEFRAGKIGELFNQTGVVNNYTIPESGALPSTLANDSQGRIWFGDEKAPGSIWVFTPSNHSFHQYYTKTPYSTPVGVAVDSGDNVWFTETNTSRIGELTPSSNMIEYTLPTANAGPALLALQRGTSYLWIAESFVGKIARFDTSAGVFQEFNPSISLRYPVGIAVDKKGSIWLSEHGGSSVVEFIPSNSTFRKFPTAQPTDVPATGPATLSLDQLGRVWFVEHYANKVGRLDPSTGRIVEFVIPTPGAFSLADTTDSAGNFWFTQFDADKIGMIPWNATSPAAIVTAPIPSTPITAGQSIGSAFLVSNSLSESITVSLSVTSSFTPNATTSRSEIALSNYSLTLGSGQTRLVTAVITPDFSLPSNIYAAGVVVTYGNTSAIGIVFLNVQGSYLYLLEYYLPAIIIVAAIASLLLFFLIRKRKSAPKDPLSKPTAKAGSSVTRLLLIIAVIVQATGVANAKCPGLPPPPVGVGGSSGPDYYGIALDVGSITFFALVAYLLIRSRLRARRPGNGKESSN